MTTYSSSQFARRQALLLGLTATVSMLIFAAGCGEVSAQTATTSQPKQIAYQLVNVTIPPESSYRTTDQRLNNPPTLYVEIQEDGVRIGKQSDQGTGWSVDYPKKVRNQWSITVESEARYTIKLWDNQYGFGLGDQQVLEITGLKGEDFAKPIYESGNLARDKDRLVRFTFKQVKTASASAPATTKP